MGKTKKRKQPEAWQLADAKRLEAIWDGLNPKPMSQELFAEKFLGSEDRSGTQGLFYQYVSGRIPLNLEAALKFARGLKVKLSDISPRLAENLRGYVVDEAGLTVELSDDERQRLGAVIGSIFENLPKLAKLPPDRQALMTESINGLLDTGNVPDDGLRTPPGHIRRRRRIRR